MGERNDERGIQRDPTFMVHYHVILDPKDGFLDHAIAQARWDSFRPVDAVELGDFRDTKFGKVEFEVIDGAEGIAKYVCKYVSKGPKLGLPEWFQERLDQGFRLVGYSVSRGFWKWAGETTRRCASRSTCRNPVESVQTASEKRLRGKDRNWRDRLAGCGKGAYLRSVRATLQMGVEGYQNKRYVYLGHLSGKFADYKKFFDQLTPDDRSYAAFVVPPQPLDTAVRYGPELKQQVEERIMGPGVPLELDDRYGKQRQEAGNKAGQRSGDQVGLRAFSNPPGGELATRFRGP